MIQANNLTLIGEFFVDSGQAIVGDPCYLDEWQDWDSNVEPYENNLNKVGEYGYLGACNATSGKGFGQLGGMHAVAFSTGYGDGTYPVYAEINEEGRVVMIVIPFNDEEYK